LLGEVGDDGFGLLQIALDVRDQVGLGLEGAEAFKGARSSRKVSGEIDEAKGAA
jgi:hypothetical protein